MAHALSNNVRPEFAHLEKDEMLLAITVPEGTKTGDNINVAGPDGRIFSIHIPAGCKAGSQMNVVVKKPEPTEEASAPGPPPPAPGPPPPPPGDSDEEEAVVEQHPINY